MPPHESPHPHAGVRVSVASGHYAGTTPEIVDWYDRVTDRPWTDGTDPRAHRFAFRSAYERLPLDAEVVLARFRFGEEHLLHASELGAPAYALAPIEARP